MTLILAALACAPADTDTAQELPTLDTAPTDTDTDGDTASPVDTAAGADTAAEDEVQVEEHLCDDGSGASYRHAFAAVVEGGEAPRVGLWTYYAEAYIEWLGEGAPVAGYSATVEVDGDGHPLGACIWLAADGFTGFYAERLELVSG